ncbi:DUF262 domain-containing protein [Flavisolibacter sp. BT320]|nr:DUF262 domain-containing protein [Flavisolibacter longurius]
MIQKSNFREKAELLYNPDDVNIRLQYFRVFDIVEMLRMEALDIFDKQFEETKFWLKEKGVQVNLFGDESDEGEGDIVEIDIDDQDDLQRNAGLWNVVQKSRFIESLMIRIPIPAFYFDGSQKPWRVVDGLQRLHTIRSFLRDEFKLTSLEYLQKECGGKNFNDLKFPSYLKQRILDAKIVAYVINPGTPNNVKHNIFKRINTGGLQLNGQEIRNAFFPGVPAEFTKTLAGKKEFLKATNSKVSSRRMVDREYANRFIAFQVFDYKEYNGKMDFFLSEAMNDLYYREPYELNEIENLFVKSMDRAHKIFGEHAFYRPKGNEDWGRLPNKAVFDTLSWNLVELRESSFSIIVNHRKEFIPKYRRKMESDELLYRAINDTTGSKTAVKNRIEVLSEFIKSFVE